MTLDIVTIPCLSDNYAFLAHDTETDTTALIDIPEAAPILAALENRGWGLDTILITHHHDDHIMGLNEVLAAHPAEVIGGKDDAHRLPALSKAVVEGDRVSIGSQTGQVIDVSGHTNGHLAFYFESAKVVFTADSLMALGCGRVFEGTKPQMWASLQKLKDLPGDTLVCSGHEYTAANAAFAATIDPENPDLLTRIAQIKQARSEGKPTVPSLLSLEKATNPFLRADDAKIAAHLGMTGASPVDVFTEIRRRKDNF